MILRKKTSDSELSAGPTMPLIDQTAINEATFVVEINDNYERDINDFEKVFTDLKNHNVVKRIMPSWRRPSSEDFEPKKTHFSFF